MATGPFNESEHAVTNDIPEPIGYTANGQFAASLTVLHNSKQAQRTHLGGQTPANGRQINRRRVEGVIYAKAITSHTPSRIQTYLIKLVPRARSLQPRMHIIVVVAPETSVEDIRHIIHNRAI